MLDTTNLFERHIEECRNLAAQSRNKYDGEFWLKMAARWEGLLKHRQNGGESMRGPTKLRRSMFKRSMLLARRAAKRRRAA
jgi:hypothetical protein